MFGRVSPQTLLEKKNKRSTSNTKFTLSIGYFIETTNFHFRNNPFSLSFLLEILMTVLPNIPKSYMKSLKL